MNVLLFPGYIARSFDSSITSCMTIKLMICAIYGVEKFIEKPNIKIHKCNDLTFKLEYKLFTLTKQATYCCSIYGARHILSVEMGLCTLLSYKT